MSSDLPEKFLVKAESELHETATVRDQSLREFRQWIAQHDYFAECRKGGYYIFYELYQLQHHCDESMTFFPCL